MKQILQPDILVRNWHWIRWVFPSIAIIYRFIEQLSVYFLWPDTMLQISASRELLNGNGLGIWVAFPDDLSHRIFQSLDQWPPGYSFWLTVPLSILKNPLTAIRFLDFVGIAIFFFSLFIILECLGDVIRVSVRFLIWIYLACVHAPLHFGFGSDLLALAFFMASLAAFLWAIVNSCRLLPWSIFSGLLMGISALTRYAYWPLILAIPSSLILCSYHLQKRELKWGAILYLLASLIILIPVISLSHPTSASTPSLSLSAFKTDPDFYLSNLSKFPPFSLDALGFREGWDLLYWKLGLHRLAFLIFGSDSRAYNATLWIAFIIILWAPLREMRLYRSFDSARKQGTGQSGLLLFNVTGILTLLLVVLSLAYLSVRWVPQMNFSGWTFVSDRRYYLPVHTFLLIWFLKFNLEPNVRHPTFLKAFISLLFLLLSFQFKNNPSISDVVFSIGNLSFLIYVLVRWTFSSDTTRYAGWRGIVGIIFFISALNLITFPITIFSNKTKLSFKRPIIAYTFDGGLFAKSLEKTWATPFPLVYVEGSSELNHYLNRTSIALLNGITPMQLDNVHLDKRRPIATKRPVSAVVGLPKLSSGPWARYLKELCEKNRAIRLGEANDVEVFQFTLMPEKPVAKRQPG